MFQVKTLNNLNNPTEHELGLCDRLLGGDYFPQSLWVMSLRACVLYHMHGKSTCFSLSPIFVMGRRPPNRNFPIDFGQAEVQFKKIRTIDPYRIDDIDVYSNILYVSENRLELSKLAHDFLALDKDRPEICALVGTSLSPGL